MRHAENTRALCMLFFFWWGKQIKSLPSRPPGAITRKREQEKRQLQLPKRTKRTSSFGLTVVKKMSTPTGKGCLSFTERKQHFAFNVNIDLICHHNTELCT